MPPNLISEYLANFSGGIHAPSINMLCMLMMLCTITHAYHYSTLHSKIHSYTPAWLIEHPLQGESFFSLFSSSYAGIIVNTFHGYSNKNIPQLPLPVFQPVL